MQAKTFCVDINMLCAERIQSFMEIIIHIFIINVEYKLNSLIEEKIPSAK